MAKPLPLEQAPDGSWRPTTEFQARIDEARAANEVPIGHPLAPELPFDEIWTPEPDAKLIVPAMGLAPGPVHLVTGSWYTGKTLLLLTIGMAVASGRDLFGLYSVKRGRWCHFDHEMGRRHMKRYVQRLRCGTGIDVEELRGNISLRVLPALNLCHTDAENAYVEILGNYDVCTIDPLRAAAPGQNENESEFRQWIDLLNRVSDRTGCVIIVLHHGGKPVQGAERRNTGRGTSAIDDAVQTKFVLTAEEKGAPIYVSHEKTRELNQPMSDFWLEVRGDDNGVCLVHLDPEQMEQARERRESEKAARCKKTILAALEKYAGKFTGTRAQLLDLVGGHRSAVNRALSDMVQSGELRSEGRGETRQWYSVPNRYPIGTTVPKNESVPGTPP